MLSLSEPVSIKRITLRLYGTMRLNWYDPVLAAKLGSTRPIKYEKIVYEHEWNNLEVASKGSGHSTPVSGSSSHTHQLPVGNHEFPFEVILPGSIDESVEGVDGAEVLYKMVATVERSRFANNFVAKKHLRIVRTLGPDVLELAQTMSIENTWPDKVQYSISVPAKAIPIGGYTQISFSFTPLLKGLKLGKTRIQLVGFKSLRTTSSITANTERILVEHIIPAPEDGFDGHDEWKFFENFQMPSSLTKCTQDCQIGSFIKISHKFRFSIALHNPDGHTSELRASVPISLFISPNVSITSRHETNIESIIHRHSHSNDEDQLFLSSPLSTSFVPPTHLLPPTSHPFGISAPPSYHNHIYDTLWGEIPAPHLDTPLTSGQSTPHLLRSNSSDNVSHGFEAHDRSRLLSNLYALQERQNQSQVADSDNYPTTRNGTSPHHGTPPLHANTSLHHSRSPSGANSPAGTQTPAYSQLHTTTGAPTSDYFLSSHHSAALPSSPDYQHLSRPVSPRVDTSNININGNGNNSNGLLPDALDIEILSRVPSYNTAITSEPTPSVENTPTYEDRYGTASYFPQVFIPRHSGGNHHHHNHQNSHHSIHASLGGSASNSHSNSLSNLSSFFSRHKSTKSGISTPIQGSGSGSPSFSSLSIKIAAAAAAATEVPSSTAAGAGLLSSPTSLTLEGDATPKTESSSEHGSTSSSSTHLNLSSNSDLSGSSRSGISLPVAISNDR